MDQYLQKASKIQHELGLGPSASKIVVMRFEFPTYTNKQIAELFKISEQRVGAVLRHPKVLKAFPVLARRHLSGMIPEAVAKYKGLMKQTENLEVSRKVTHDVLTSQKVLEPTPHIQVNVFQNMSNDELRAFLGRSEGLPAVQETSIDAEIVDDVPPA